MSENHLMTQDQKYELDKVIGNRDDSGRWKLQKLGPQHRRMIAASSQGVSHKVIAEMLGVTRITVDRVLNDPLAQEYLKTLYAGLEKEIRGLAYMSIAAIREIMESAPNNLTKFQAIDKVEKFYKLLVPEARSGIGGGLNLQINNSITNESSETKDAVSRLLDKFGEMNLEKRFSSSENVVDAEIIESEEKEE